MKFDLHVHSNYSDGKFSPSKIVQLGVEKGLSGLAITDHDTTGGIDEAIKESLKYDNFKVIPGVEFSSMYNDEEVHILGYFIDYHKSNFIEMTNALIKSRTNRGVQIIKKLNNLGYEISLRDVTILSGKEYIGRPHIAKALIEKGYVNSVQQAFDQLLAIGRPGYINRYKLSIEECINLIKQSKGFSILAHPGLLKDKDIIQHCIKLGIDGIECIHSKHSESDSNLFIKIARENNLIITGGSDCHGENINGSVLLGDYYIDINNIPQFKEMI